MGGPMKSQKQNKNLPEDGQTAILPVIRPQAIVLGFAA
jgi:hypothetical protein